MVIAQRDPASAARTVQEIEAAGGTAFFVETDVSQRQAVEHLVAETVAHFERVDILVNNAAILGANGPFLEVSQEVWERVLGTNITGVFMCSQAAARVMARTGGGSIIHISSSNAFIPQPNCCAYAAAKGALETLCRSMAVDLAPHGIRVNVVAPGPIQSRVPDADPPRATETTLLRRVGLPSEVASAITFLASDEASFITGQSLNVDGGMLINAYSIYHMQR